uniref:Uncharacterized protein n=1 Tax=Strigamia maritima TaxID=126957 RepID=T1JIQ6_STRMM
MLLAPSDIQFLCVGATNLGDLGDLSKDYIVSNFALPKLQVAGKDGAWFALNNSLLHIVRELERLGKCDRVKVDVVSLSKVPATVQSGMVVQPAANANVDDNCKTPDPSRETKRGYEKLPDRTLDEGKTDDADEDDECSSSDCSDGADRFNSDSDSDQEVLQSFMSLRDFKTQSYEIGI